VNEEVGQVRALQRPVDALPALEVAADVLDADTGRRTGAARGHPDDPVGPEQSGKQPAADEAGPPEDHYPFHESSGVKRGSELSLAVGVAAAPAGGSIATITKRFEVAPWRAGSAMGPFCSPLLMLT